MPTLHMLHGFIGAGKTTFAKKLEKETGAVRFTPDEWIVRLHGANPPAETFGTLLRDVKKLILDEAREVLESGRDAILDFGFWTRADRDAARNFARENGAQASLYDLQCTEDVMKRRIRARTAAMPPGELFIDGKAFEEFKKYFEPLDPVAETSITVKTDV